MHFPRVFHWASAGFAVLLLSIQVQAQAYRLSSNQLAIDRRSHWVNWEIAGGLVEISPDGRVTPRFIQKNTNAALDAEQFENSTGPGGLEVGSNPSEARNLIDGDLDTSWGPDPDSPLENWRFTLHLGRIVVAAKIVLRFAAEDVGDPFLQFKVLTLAPGTQGGLGSALRPGGNEYPELLGNRPDRQIQQAAKSLRIRRRAYPIHG